jgi:hypothetical protein
MAENIDDLTIAFYQDDRNVLKELQKIVLTRGNWTTIMYLFQELNKKTNEYEPPKVSIRRYQKRGGVYKQQSKFNISSAKQGREIASILLNWFPEGVANEAVEPPEKPERKPRKPKAAAPASTYGEPPPRDDEDDDEENTMQSDI